MESKDAVHVNSSVSDLGLAAVSGGGTGTLLAYLAQSLPTTNPYKSLFIILAPSASVAITSFWVWATAEYNKRRQDSLVQKKITEMRENLLQKINDPKVKPNQKKEYERQLAILEEKSFQRDLKIIES